MTLETVFSSFSSAEAQMIAARLDTAGFHPTVTDEIASMSMDGYSMATGGIRIKVPHEEQEGARGLVESLLSEESTETDQIPLSKE
jgi:hypothetical protein